MNLKIALHLQMLLYKLSINQETFIKFVCLLYIYSNLPYCRGDGRLNSINRQIALPILLY